MNKKKPTPWKVIPVSGKNEKKKTESAADKATKVKATTKLQTEKTDHSIKTVKEEDNLDELFGSIKRTKSTQDSCLQSDQLNQSDFEMFDTRGTRKSSKNNSIFHSLLSPFPPLFPFFID